jgi:hypothetical protein
VWDGSGSDRSLPDYRAMCGVVEGEDGIKKCRQSCQRNSNRCRAINVVPWHNPSAVVFPEHRNIPRSDACSDERLAAAGVSDDALICYGLKPDTDKTVDAAYVISYDPEDPVFYSTCWKRESVWVFDGPTCGEACRQPSSETAGARWNFGDACVGCDSGVDNVMPTVTPKWELSSTCRLCSYTQRVVGVDWRARSNQNVSALPPAAPAGGTGGDTSVCGDATTSADPEFDCMASLQTDPEYTMHWRPTLVAGVAAMKIKLTLAQEAWLAWGHRGATDPPGKMSGSSAVIGLPGVGSVRKYAITGRSESAVQAVADERQTLGDATLSQEDGVTTMQFTKLLEEPGEPKIVMNGTNLVFAFGQANELGYHGSQKGGLTVSFAAGGGAIVRVDASTSGWQQDARTAHGVLMGLGFGLLMPLGAIMARWHGDCCCPAAWFKVHRLGLSPSIAWILIHLLSTVYIPTMKDKLEPER